MEDFVDSTRSSHGLCIFSQMASHFLSISLLPYSPKTQSCPATSFPGVMWLSVSPRRSPAPWLFLSTACQHFNIYISLMKKIKSIQFKKYFQVTLIVFWNSLDHRQQVRAKNFLHTANHAYVLVLRPSSNKLQTDKQHWYHICKRSQGKTHQPEDASSTSLYTTEGQRALLITNKTP